MKKIRIIHLDDEKLARDSFKLIIESFDEFELLGQASSALEGVKLINLHHPDAVFLDINMPGGSGFDLLDTINEIKFEVVFLTAYDKYAIKAIEKNAIAYLLKPIDLDELALVTKRLINKINTTSNKVFNPFTGKIFISINDGVEIIDYKNIISIEASSNYSLFHLVNGKTCLVSKTLKDFEIKLPRDQFLRCHRSHIINYNHVIKYLNKNGGFLELSNNNLIPISDNKKDEFLSHIVE